MKENLQPASRADLYTVIHKAVRAFLCDTLTAVGKADAEDEQEMAGVLAQVRGLANFCETHLKHENDFVHAALEARRPGSSKQTAGDHVHHESAIAQVRTFADDVEKTEGAKRSEALLKLYRYLALFVAENLTHMNIEETDNQAALWSAYTDEELIGIERALIASLKPEELMVGMRWMLVGLTPGERAAKLAGIRMGAPAPAFEAILGLARTHLSQKDWRKLSQALALPEPMAA